MNANITSPPRRRTRSRRALLVTIIVAVVTSLLALVLLTAAIVFIQGRRTPAGAPDYVALGSSFAAGAGLGELQRNSPLACGRSLGGYPQVLARIRRISIVDMSCGGAATKHILDGGQYFQGPQVRTITPETRLVTITTGGNDVGYVGDLSLMAMSKSNGPFGWFLKAFWTGPKAARDRDFAGLHNHLVETVRTIHERAPSATVVLAAYPTILPATGTCDRLALNPDEVRIMREVADQLAETTRAAATEGDAVFVDMNRIGASHHACSETPWTNGWLRTAGAPFHPTRLGAASTAAAIEAALGNVDPRLNRLIGHPREETTPGRRAKRA